jgi:hypothetical protein
VTCTNWMLTVLALVVFGVAVWPGVGGGTSGITMWILGIAALIMLVLAWTGIDCKLCQATESKSKA